MTTIATSAPTVAIIQSSSAFDRPAGSDPHSATVASQKQSQRLARLTGLFFLLTYATSIPPVLALYVPALSDPAFVLGGQPDMGMTWGAILEILLIVANIASALTLYPLLRKRFPVLSLGFVAARI